MRIVRAGTRSRPAGLDDTAGQPPAGEAGAGETTRDQDSGRRRTAGIYGAIITAAILAAAGGEVSTGLLTIDVLVSLFVYWSVEAYAELLGARADAVTPLRRQQVRDQLVATWPMMSASFGPLAVVLCVRVAGASDMTAASAGLGAAAVLLVFHMWSAGRGARLRGLPLIAMTLVASFLGAVMIVLKNFVLVHLH